MVFFFDDDAKNADSMPNDRINDRINLSDSERFVFDEIKKNPYVKTEELVFLTGLSMLPFLVALW